MSFPYTFSPAVQADIARILETSEEEFGPAARLRYAALINTALSDIAANPYRVESRAWPELGRGARSWHLQLSRERARTPTGMVSQPRHIIFYRIEAGVVIIERVLHERQDLRRKFAR
ncbi:hypothetical protein AXK11_02955 [Cephaloticoccus primus]|uniref:Plasmid stabilization protein ParE n=1 Tax=Cephaloticoccus primus TaxID=1548207 RepID=A0A139SRB8_9BACT|nr:type II toxin-antitoxin system RelE/ParE family toxin [Cephaloticoccus primus]KXU37145.1 hypothetical protein AXK11_02955 [Cephaloticoccus primus]